jgi:hypothetical protein
VNDRENDHLGKLENGQERDFWKSKKIFLTFHLTSKKTNKNEKRVFTTSSTFGVSNKLHAFLKYLCWDQIED